MSYAQPKMLTRYLIDCGTGITQQGPAEVIVLVLTSGTEEFPVCMSREDATMIAAKLQEAVAHCQARVDLRAGFKS